MNNAPAAHRLVIVGQGAIGSLLAAKAQQQQVDYGVIPRNKQPLAMHYQHLASGLSVDFTPTLVTQLSPQDIILLPLKAFQIDNALAHLTIPTAASIVLMHNGMGTIEQTQARLPNNPILAATTSYGVYKPHSNTLVETGQGKTAIGWVQHPNTTVQQCLQSFFAKGLGPLHWHKHIQLALWQKLAVNAVINPLTAIHQIKNGGLQDPQFNNVIHEICQEVTLVMQSLNMPVTIEALKDNVREVIINTANNYSSMNRDIAAGRPSEIDFINGYIVQQADKLGINVSRNQRLWQQVSQLAQQS